MSNYVSKRTDASQAFDYEELMAILEREARREIVEEKRQLKLIDYSIAKRWLKLLNIKDDPFLEGYDIKEIMNKANKSKESIGEKTLTRLKRGDKEFLTLIDEITKYLGVEDKLEKSDFIFVFGGKNLGRIEKAVELWKEGWAPKIWISGGHPIYQEYEAEAVTFKRRAIENGVPEEVIYTEANSITIADNIRKSLNLMDEEGIPFNKIIMVISWYAQKRAWMTMEKYIEGKDRLININAKMEIDNKVSPSKWYESDYGINIVYNEFLKMKIHDCLVMNKII